MDELVRRAGRQDPVRLAIHERRMGRGIGVDVQPWQLAKVLVHQWISTWDWAAVRVSFKEVAIVRPGRLHELPGYMPWMSGLHQDLSVVAGQITPSLFHIAKMQVVDQRSLAYYQNFNELMLTWLDTPQMTTRFVDHEAEKVSTRAKETWNIEHVRLHCGMDPIEPSPKGLVVIEPTKVGTCASCRSVEGRMRSNGRVLCYGCHKGRR